MVIRRSSARLGHHARVDEELRVLPCGDRALLVEVADPGVVAGLRTALERAPLPGQRELVPAAGTVLVLSPGGWQLVGRTDAVLFDVDREPPALLRPGVRVRLRG
jgi:allophanate hydrolase subunit 1